MLLSVLGLTVMHFLTRYLGTSVSSWTKTFYRSLFTLLFVLLWMLVRGERIRFYNRPVLILRGVAGAISITLFFWAIDLIGLLAATLYLYLYPVFAILFAMLLFKERFSPWFLAPLAAALAGLYLIVNPTFDSFTLGHGIGMVNAITSGIARASLRKLRKTDSPANIVVVFMSFGMVLSGAGVLLLPGQSWHFNTSAGLGTPVIWIILIGIAACSAFSLITVTIAYGHLSTATASIMTMLILPLTAVIAVLYFHESLTVSKIVGGLLITGAGIGVTLIPSEKSSYS